MFFLRTIFARVYRVSTLNEKGESERSRTMNRRKVQVTEPRGFQNMPFDITQFAAAYGSQDRYARHIADLRANGWYTDSIVATTDAAMKNLAENNARSFVIYGQPQSGKTAMMIALTARLLDFGKPIIIVLVNDNVQLLNQNLARFRRAKLDPTPHHFNDVLDSEVSLDHGQWIIFCKKNPSDLRKIIQKLDPVRRERVVIDDEADYASPNSKINRGEQTRINQLVEALIGDDGTYIGVTATPARLNLNNTFDNASDQWVLFAAHPEYVGYDTFFPLRSDGPLRFILMTLPEGDDSPAYLREALFRFLVNVGYLNAVANAGQEQNYSMLIHTSGIRADHSKDYGQVLKTLKVLSAHDVSSATFVRYFERLRAIAEERYPQHAPQILSYIAANIGRRMVVVMNSSPNSSKVDYQTATSPTAPFTFAIGGNIVSRGVTFDNLISMFFTRDVKHRIQQDTYIQRARMFGSRKPYLDYFELCIPAALYDDWHRCFVYHALALESIRSGEPSPVWLEDTRIAAVAASSIDRATVNIDGGEMSFELFDYDDRFAAICAGAGDPIERLKRLQMAVGIPALPEYLLRFIESFMPAGPASVAVHPPASMAGSTSADRETITRARGFMGTSTLEESRYPQASHHVKIFHNGAGKAKVFYKFTGNVRFLRVAKAS